MNTQNGGLGGEMKDLTLYHTILTFNKGPSLLKILWEKEKVLVTIIFSFSLFYSIKDFKIIYFVVGKCFQFGPG